MGAADEVSHSVQHKNDYVFPDCSKPMDIKTVASLKISSLAAAIMVSTSRRKNGEHHAS